MKLGNIFYLKKLIIFYQGILYNSKPGVKHLFLIIRDNAFLSMGILRETGGKHRNGYIFLILSILHAL